VFIAVGMLKNKNMESQLIKEARELAFCYHADQKYGNSPYSDHLQMVVNLVRIYSSMIPKDDLEDVICAAYLHDILEDTLCTHDEILRALNPRILLLVKLLTKNGSDPESYFNQVAQDDLAIFIKLCDRYANVLACVQDDNYEKLNKYKKQNPYLIRILLNKNYIELMEGIEGLLLAFD
jgi:(p)ppGpp synthase/HD superfamily hydrolase